MRIARIFSELDTTLSSIDSSVASVSVFTFYRKGVDIHPENLQKIKHIDESCFSKMSEVCASLKNGYQNERKRS